MIEKLECRQILLIASGYQFHTYNNLTLIGCRFKNTAHILELCSQANREVLNLNKSWHLFRGHDDDDDDDGFLNTKIC